MTKAELRKEDAEGAFGIRLLVLVIPWSLVIGGALAISLKAKRGEKDIKRLTAAPGRGEIAARLISLSSSHVRARHLPGVPAQPARGRPGAATRRRVPEVPGHLHGSGPEVTATDRGDAIRPHAAGAPVCRSPVGPGGVPVGPVPRGGDRCGARARSGAPGNGDHARRRQRGSFAGVDGLQCRSRAAGAGQPGPAARPRTDGREVVGGDVLRPIGDRGAGRDPARDRPAVAALYRSLRGLLSVAARAGVGAGPGDWAVL